MPRKGTAMAAEIMAGKNTCALPNSAAATATLNHQGWRDRTANSESLLAILECTHCKKNPGLYERHRRTAIKRYQGHRTRHPHRGAILQPHTRRIRRRGDQDRVA